MNHVRLADYGQHLASRERARRLREELFSPKAGEATVEIDLAGVQSISGSFADEFFAVLAATHGEEWFRQRVHVVNAADPVRRMILQVLRNRLAPETRTAGYELPPPPAELALADY